jgi:hypothetical protein
MRADKKNFREDAKMRSVSQSVMSTKQTGSEQGDLLPTDNVVVHWYRFLNEDQMVSDEVNLPDWYWSRDSLYQNGSAFQAENEIKMKYRQTRTDMHRLVALNKQNKKFPVKGC